MGNKCFLCGRNGSGDPLDRHHIFGGANRRKSEKYDLVVLLCGSEFHRNGEYSAHKNKNTRIYLHRYGQKKAMEENVWSIEDFIREFGRNYL